jgi:hypothetical protein
MKKNNSNFNQSYVAAFLTLFYVVLVLPINESVAFNKPDNLKTTVLSYLLKTCFTILLFFAIKFLMHFYTMVKNNDEIYVLWLKISLIYLFLLTILLVLIYPGHWVGDEFYILNAAKNYAVESWQNYFTIVYYTFSLYMLPTGVSIVIVQMIFSSFVVGYLISNLYSKFSNKRIWLLTIAPFLLPPILINIFYPLRLTLYSFILLLLVGRLFFIIQNNIFIKKQHQEIIFLSFLIALVSFWRTEGIIYLSLFPVSIYVTRYYMLLKKKDIKSYAVISLCVVIISLGLMINKATLNPRYELTAYINPLSTMIQGELRGDKTEESLTKINKAIDLNIVRDYPSFTEIPSYWKGAVKSDFIYNSTDLRKGYYYIVIHNLDKFFANRINTFLATNSFGNVLPLGLGHFSKEEYRTDPYTINFIETNKFSEPINYNIKLATTKFLIMGDENNDINLIGHYIWNIIPVVLLLLGLMIHIIIKKKYIQASILASLLISALLIFLTAPASYFMYYLPLYIVGYYILVISALFYLDKKVS